MPRAYHHDYKSRCIYHLTLSKAAGIPDFSRISGALPNVGVELSPTGKIIEHHLRSLIQICPKMRLLQYVVMPDHVHLLAFVTEKTELALGSYISMLKIAIRHDLDEQTAFQPDFYDRILYKDNSLDAVYQYIRQNPYRLAIRRAHPDFFRRTHSLEIDSQPYSAYGNLQLMDNPFKSQVVIHRADSPKEKERKRDQWLHLAANGGILVSPFISKEEKEIRKEAEALGGKNILINDRTLRDREKPAAHDFALCEQGRLLIVSANAGEFSRSTCLKMNSLAAKICLCASHSWRENN